jgi:hypothetical protein
MSKPGERPLVMVEWSDITGHDTPWVEQEDVLEMTPAPMVTVGIVVNLTEDYLTIAGTWESGSEPQFGNVNCIPRGCVRNLTELLVPLEGQGDQMDFWSKNVSA